MDLRALRKRCQALLETLDLTIPFDLNEFCGRLGTRLGCPIDLVAQPMPPEMPGRALWFHDRLVIAFERDTSLFHQQYIVFHELGHVLFQHDLSQTLQAIPLRVSLDAPAIRRALARSGHLTQPEQEAEVFASLLVQRVAPTPIMATHYRPDDPRARQLEAFMAGSL